MNIIHVTLNSSKLWDHINKYALKDNMSVKLGYGDKEYVAEHGEWSVTAYFYNK